MSNLAKFMQRNRKNDNSMKSPKDAYGDFESANLWVAEEKKAVGLNRDRAGIADYVFRVLPNHPDQEETFNIIHTHQYYNESDPKKSITFDCLQNYGQEDCPICRMQELGYQDHINKGGVAENMPKFIKSMRAKRGVYGWIYIREDKFRPENEGKVFLTEMKAIVFDLISKHQDEALLTKMRKLDQMCDILDLEEGADILMIANYNVDPFDRYNTSEAINFKSPLSVDEDEANRILDQIPSLIGKETRFFSKYARCGKTPNDARSLYETYKRSQPGQRFPQNIESAYEMEAGFTAATAGAPQRHENQAEQQSAPQNQPMMQQQSAPQNQPMMQQQPTQQAAPTFDDFDEDIPF